MFHKCGGSKKGEIIHIGQFNTATMGLGFTSSFTIDVKKVCPNYKKLSAGNFLVTIEKITFLTDNSYVNLWGSITYDSENGILTLTGYYGQANNRYYHAPILDVYAVVL